MNAQTSLKSLIEMELFLSSATCKYLMLCYLNSTIINVRVSLLLAFRLSAEHQMTIVLPDSRGICAVTLEEATRAAYASLVRWLGASECQVQSYKKHRRER